MTRERPRRQPGREMEGMQRLPGRLPDTASRLPGRPDSGSSSPRISSSPRRSIFSSQPRAPCSPARTMASRETSRGSREELRSPVLKKRGSQKSLGERRDSSTRNIAAGSSPKSSPRGVPPTPPRSPRPDTAGPLRPQGNTRPLASSSLAPCEYEELPKLPLPPLAATLAQLLDNLKPLLDDASYLAAERRVKDYGRPGGVGEKAWKVLEARRETMDNWAYQYWMNEMYMDYRLPLPVNINPGMVFPRQQFAGVGQLLAFTSRVVSGFTRFKQRLDMKALPQDKAASREPGQPLCMAQYYRVLTTYRQPGHGRDKQVSSGEEAKSCEHIVVGKLGRWFRVPVKTAGRWLPVEDIFSSLHNVWEEAERAGPVAEDCRVSYLTASHREKWAAAWDELRNPCISSRQDNRDSVQAIASSLLLVCLDEEPQNASDTTRSMKDTFRQMLTGAGSRFNGGNRWFDKTVQLVVGLDGVCGLCYEHSPSEGIAVVQLLEGIIKDLGTKGCAPIAYHPKSAQSSQLEWSLDPGLRKSILEARGVLDSLDNDNDLEVFHFTGYGKDFIKSSRCSPDSWLQMSLQLTMYRLTGGIVPTYESASTRRFQLGRVDSIRASHPEAQAWCRAMCDSKACDRRERFGDAMKKQTKVMVDNILGHGLDVPLSGLREATRELGLLDSDCFFSADFYSRLCTFQLSTSQVPVGLPLSFMGYGAVVPGGYGVSYNPMPDSVIFCICSFHSFPGTSSRRFAAVLQQSLQDMQELFTK